MLTLKAGTMLFHGTDSDDFDEECDSLRGPAWVSSSFEVAARFASRSGGWGGVKRVVAYGLMEDVMLHQIGSARQMQEFAEEHGLDLCGVEEMRDSVEASGIPGWVIPNNYPDGDDILIVDTSVLDYVETRPVSTADQKPKRPVF